MDATVFVSTLAGARLTRVLALVAVLATSAPPPVDGQSTLDPLDTWERQAQRQLFLHRSTLDLDDLTHEVGIGSLDDGESTRFEFTAEGPGSFRVLAVCDNDCTDIDLTLYDLDGNQIDEDIELDDFPWVDTGQVGSGVSRTYSVRVSMPSCEVDPCRFAVAVFDRG